MTYARARLWLGITGVGSIVSLSALALATGLPARLLPTAPAALAVEALALAGLLAVYLLWSLPLDIAGGWYLPRRFGRSAPRLGPFFAGLARAYLVQVTIWAAAFAVLLGAARSGSAPAVLAAALVLMSLLIAGQSLVARLVAPLRPLPDRGLASDVAITVLAADDPGFTGGVIGWPGRESIALPARWLETLDGDQLAAELSRRVGLLRSGSRRRGLLLAVLFNLACVAAAIAVAPGRLDSVAGLTSVSLVFTLLSFLGLLILPTLSRPGVLEGDRAALAAGTDLETLVQTIRRLDGLQDDEPARGRLVETLFHPIPSVDQRRRALAGDGSQLGFWHAARMALFLSWGCLGLLARAVHCNCGRPQLWVMLPAD